MTEEVVDTTTKFIGDIVFNNGEKDINASDLVTVDEVNDVLKECVKKDEVIDVPILSVKIPIIPVTEYNSYTLDINYNNPPKIIYIDAPPERKETYTLDFNTYCVAYKSTDYDTTAHKLYISRSSAYIQEGFYGDATDPVYNIDTSYVIYDISNENDDAPKEIPTVEYVKQMINESTPTIPTVDKLSDVEAKNDMSGYEANDEHLMSSAAIKHLIDSSTPNVDLSGVATKSEVDDLNSKLFETKYPDDIVFEVNNANEIARYIASNNETIVGQLGKKITVQDKTFTFINKIPCCSYVLRVMRSNFDTNSYMITLGMTEVMISADTRIKVIINEIDLYHVVLTFERLDFMTMYLFGKDASEVTPIQMSVYDSLMIKISSLEERIEELESKS